MASRSQMTFRRSSNDLVITRSGTTTDNIRVLNWFTVTNNQLDFVQFSDQTMTSAQINALFGTTLAAQQTAMASADRTTGTDALVESAGLFNASAADSGSTPRKRSRVLPWTQTHRLLDANLASMDADLIGADPVANVNPIVSCGVANAEHLGVSSLHHERRDGFARYDRSDLGLRARIA